MDDAQAAALATLTGQMFAEPIATGEVVVTDPEPPAAPVAVVEVAAPAMVKPTPGPPPVPIALTPEEPELAAPPENVPTFKPRLDEDQQAFLDEPDFDAEAAAEVAAEVDSEEYEYDDPEVQARLRALEKRNQFLEGQVVAKSRKGWVEEAKRAYPDLARLIPGEIEAIGATSRRAFLRAADAANTKYATVLGPTLAKLEAERAAIASGAVEVARTEVANAWGKPSSDTLPAAAVAEKEALDKARATGGLEGAIKELMKTTPVL